MQAWWRKILVLRRLEREARTSKQNLLKLKNIPPESQALKAFCDQLKLKKLTPESFFRVCDTDYQQKVPVDIFRQRISDLGIGLTKA